MAACSSTAGTGDDADATTDAAGRGDISVDTGTDPGDDASEEDVAEDIAAEDVAEEDTAEDTADDTALDVEEDVEADVADATEDVAEDVGTDISEDVAEDIAEDTGPRLPNIGPLDPNGLETVRFILVGDTGEGNDRQYAVSAAAGQHCDERGGCHAMIMLGDNIYDVGPSSPEDPLLTEYIDLPYANLRYGTPPADGEEDTRERLPLLVSLGNHDLGSAGLDAALAQHYIDYGRDRDWFYFPNRYWNAQIGPVHVAALDTNPLAYLGTEVAEQAAMVDAAAESDAPWSLVFGHHPYRSEGQHGNAGSYENIPGDLTFMGGVFREFVNAQICNRADFYICGHDHDRQWLNEPRMLPAFLDFGEQPLCNTEFAVSGAGAKFSDFEGRDNDTHFKSDDIAGFLYMEFTATEATAQFVDMNGTIEWTETF